MGPEDRQDRLIDTLLREALGRETPPNLASRIMQRIALQRRRFYWTVSSLSAAAAVMLGIAIWYFAFPKSVEIVKETPPQPPEPGLNWQQSSHNPVEQKPDLTPIQPNGDADFARGQTIKTADKPKALAFGGYCKLEAAPNTSIMREGKDKAEQVFMETGRVSCEVDRHIGTFSIRTDAGTVSVTGTKFAVSLSGETNSLKTEHVSRKQLAVEVQEGSVELAGWNTTLHAGEKGGVAFGIVMKKDGEAIEIRSDSNAEPLRLTPQVRDGVDKEMREQFEKLALGSRIQVAWVKQEHPRAMKIRVLWTRPEAANDERRSTGNAVGVITEKGADFVRIKSENGESERYTPRWSGDGPKAGLDKEMVRALEKLKVGDKVRLEWVLEEHRRIVRIEKLDKE